MLRVWPGLCIIPEIRPKGLRPISLQESLPALIEAGAKAAFKVVRRSSRQGREDVVLWLLSPQRGRGADSPQVTEDGGT